MERCVHDGNISTNNGKLSFTSLRGAYGDNHNEELLSSLPGAQLSYINGSNNSCRLTTPGLPFGISPLTISCKNVHEVFFDSSKLLVVDDSPMNRKMLCKVLKQAGYTCEEASDGLEALNKVMHSLQIDEDKKTYYDCILMDFMMPNMDGPTATTEIRKIGYDGPIIGITGNVLKEDCNLFLQSGISRVLLKPVSLDTIQVILQGN
jgi:CheY-like chemotaxis protein